ncbi:glycine/D-amino acid oxidase-like deaminating enzyme [Dongia mobilis]|uniref:Glycine/D-amino acid oxidase-like deaminating enzyme n=1 Tax=Dongia mobilis TaxID=578943 RepID=A0A4R6WXP6_9PROT|nr:FAD-binding oxidoreductase [Dongia mobilis]TDQ86458.1 glycine/D-amino acid oxidase-like deaminating enzyme [Dongia mobilis]
MQHLYHATALDPAIPVPSWWRDTKTDVPAYPTLEGEIDTEIAIIGGGYTGLSAAYHLARDHDIQAVVLERAYPGWGGSGRNGGFCCMGSSKMPWNKMAAKFGLEEARSFWRSQRESVGLVAEIIDREGIDVDKTGHGEVSLAHKPNLVDALREEADYMARTFGATEKFMSKEDLVAQGLNSPGLYAGVANPVGFGLNPWKYVTGLAAATARAGARIFGNAEVIHWSREGGKHVLTTQRGRVRADKVLIATAGYTPEDLHNDYGGRVLPALSSIVVTRPITEAEQKAQGWTNTTPVYDIRYLLHYFRLLPDGRMMFGGRGGLSAEPGKLRAQQDRIEADFRAYYPEWRHVEVTHRWSGLLCLAQDLVPHVGSWDDQPGVYFAMCYHGNGVAMGTWSGRAAARAMVGGVDERPNFIRRPPPRFPLAFLRPLYLRGAYVAYGIRDSLS